MVQQTETDTGMWGLLGDYLEDLMSQSVPGSVVLLIVIVCMVPYIVRAIRSYWYRRSNNGN